MNKKLITVIIISISIIFVIFGLIIKNKNIFIDTIQYKGETYILLEYNMDIFTYNHNSNNYYEEDIIHPVSHNKWNIIYFNGDLYILDKQIEEATKYYADDKNYKWYVVFDNEDKEIKKSISVNKNELLYLYSLEKIKRTKTIIFNDIETFASILKVSKDNTVQAIITLAQVGGLWYYKTEVMTDNNREYVIKIIDSLNDKINNLKMN